MIFTQKIGNIKDILQIDKRKGIVGIILAAVAMVVCAIFGAWARSIAYGILFTAIGFVKFDVKKSWVQWLMYGIWVMIVAIVTWYAPASMVNALNGINISIRPLILNFLCIFMVWMLVFAISAKPIVSAIIASFLLFVLSTANGFIYLFRGKELGCLDILSMPTAMNVAGNYTYIISPQMAYSWMCWMFLSFLGFSLPKLKRTKKIRERQIALGAEIVIILVLWFGSGNIPIKTWDNEGSRFNGYYLNFYLGIRDYAVEKPKNYNVDTIHQMSQKYANTDAAGQIEKKPNIIVIMDESFANLRILGDVQTNMPVTPFIDSLSENTVRGYALSSVYGGNTANSEFEFLTGHSMMFLPSNCVPYQQYINKKTYSMAWQMSSYGYKSVATHPYYENGWSRNTVYPNFGFEESAFIEEYSLDNPMRDFVSDRQMFEYVIEKLNNKTPGEPLFLFGITMQNHGGYDYVGEHFENTVELEGLSGEYPKAEQYLSLIRETDMAVEYLIKELENYQEDTVLLFFGDHFPGLEPEFYEEVHGSFDTLSDQMLTYKVPFIIWANYDIPEKTVECTSINYLSGHLLQTAGLPLSPYQQFLADVEEVVPAVSATGYYSCEKGEFVAYHETSGYEKEWLGKYDSLVYNGMFDAKNRNNIFFK